MKIITLLPVKNEGWILRSTLRNMSDFSDHIVIADQKSTDDSLAIYQEFEKVQVIENKNTGHSNSVRWQLLDYARKTFGLGNIIVCVDADEMIRPEAITEIKKTISNSDMKSISFSFPWIQLWGSKEKHRVDSVWKHNYKGIAFFDDGTKDYRRETVLNDHTARVPYCEKDIRLDTFPLLHYQYINLDQSAIKQAWYRCSELVSGNDPRRINHKYAVAKNDAYVQVETVDPLILKGLPDVSFSYDTKTDWRHAEIMHWFSEYGIEKFESLDIWEIKEFDDKFIATTGRSPKPKTFPKWLIALNTIKNKLKAK